MNDNIKRIQDTLRIGQYANNPHGCAEDRAILAGEYSFLCGMLENVLKTKAGNWTLLRNGLKSDTSADRVWEATKEGIDEMGLKLRMKGIEKMMTSLNTLIQVATNQAKNNY